MIYINQDYKEAVKWFRKAAEQNHIYAQLYLGYCYDIRKGIKNGVNQSYEEALKWYTKAAEQGNSDAINELKSYGINFKNK